MKIIGVIQARMDSRRLPQKVMAEICGKPMIWHVWNRLKHCRNLDQVVCAIPASKSNDGLAASLVGLGIECYRGPEQDLINRIYGCALAYLTDAVVRITADCPFVDPGLVDDMAWWWDSVYGARKHPVAYLSNVRPRTFPRGLDVEIYSAPLLAELSVRIDDPVYREWFPIWLWEHEEEYKTQNMTHAYNTPDYNWTVDYPQDLDFARLIYGELWKPEDSRVFSADDMFVWLNEHKPELLDECMRLPREVDWPWSVESGS